MTKLPEQRPEREDVARHEPAFEALRAAMDAHDDELAERILERILARAPDADTRRYAETFARILKGRALAEALDLFLLASGVPGDRRQVRLELCVRHPGDQPLEFVSGPGSLRLLLTGVDEQGTEQRAARSLALTEVAHMSLPAGDLAVFDLGAFQIPATNSLALMAEWDLVLRPGTLRMQGVDYPANAVDVRGCTTLWRAPWLSTAPIPADSLALYVAAGGRMQAALLERAVRVDLDSREAALDALVPEALRLPLVDLEPLVPSLRWLSGRRELGSDLDAWRRWLSARSMPALPPEPALALPVDGLIEGLIELPETGVLLPAIVPVSAQPGTAHGA